MSSPLVSIIQSITKKKSTINSSTAFFPLFCPDKRIISPSYYEHHHINGQAMRDFIQCKNKERERENSTAFDKKPSHHSE